jgi:hypothetical protein
MSQVKYLVEVKCKQTGNSYYYGYNTRDMLLIDLSLMVIDEVKIGKILELKDDPNVIVYRETSEDELRKE